MKTFAILTVEDDQLLPTYCLLAEDVLDWLDLQEVRWDLLTWDIQEWLYNAWPGDINILTAVAPDRAFKIAIICEVNYAGA